MKTFIAALTLSFALSASAAEIAKISLKAGTNIITISSLSECSANDFTIVPKTYDYDFKTQKLEANAKIEYFRYLGMMAAVCRPGLNIARGIVQSEGNMELTIEGSDDLAQLFKDAKISVKKI